MLTPISGSTVSQTIGTTSAALAASASKTAAIVAKITIFNQPIRYTRDGVAATAVLGHYATDKHRIYLVNQTEIAGFRAIREGGVDAIAIVSYYEGTYTPEDIALLTAGL